MKKKESKSSAKKRGAEVTQLSNFRKGLTMNECSSCQACAPVLVKDSLLGHYLLSPKFRGGMSLSCTKELLTRSTMVKISCKRSRTLIMPLMKRAGAPIESLFRSTYDLFIYYHREGVWDPSVSIKILRQLLLCCYRHK